MVLDRVDNHRLEPAPTTGNDQRVARFEDPVIPAVFFDTDLDAADVLLAGEEAADDVWRSGVEILDEFDRNVGDLNANVEPGPEPLEFLT